MSFSKKVMPCKQSNGVHLHMIAALDGTVSDALAQVQVTMVEAEASLEEAKQWKEPNKSPSRRRIVTFVGRQLSWTGRS